jgi:hypothetical protein
LSLSSCRKTITAPATSPRAGTTSGDYGGGCAVHDFALLVVPIFLESYPVQMSGSLAHDAKGDPCRALVSSDIRFDLSPIKEAYRQSYGVQSDTVHLRIGDWPDPVVYTF